MRLSLYFAFILFIFAVQNIETKKVHKRFAVVALLKAKEFGSRVISKTLDIMTMISNNRRKEEILKTLKSLESSINQIEIQSRQSNTLLQIILHEVRKSPYSISIKDSEREIEQCFDSFKSYVVSPKSKQAIDNLKKCYEKMAYVKDIAKIASGRAVGISNVNLFEISIREHGHCNGSEVAFIQRRLKRLLMNGCSAVVAAEELIYHNTSSHYQTDCKIAFEGTDEYDEKLFERCSEEECDIVLPNMDSTLNDVHSVGEAVTALNSNFPWFYFTVFEVEHCRPDCFQENLISLTPRPFPFNLHTFNGKEKTFLVVYHDVKYSASENGEVIGFDLPRSCLLDFRNDLRLNKRDPGSSPIISIYMHLSKSHNSHARICNGTMAKCMTSSSTSFNEMGCYQAVKAMVILILILTLF